jgi:hypothetical protein
MKWKNSVFVRRRLIASGRYFLMCAALLCAIGLIHGAETNRLSTEVSFPKSVFVSEGDIGKDPFFPNSTRLKIKTPDDQSKTPQTKQDFSRLLKLTGVTGGAKPIATINNLTFAVGEEQEVKSEGRKVKIRVLEIRDKSVVVKIDNQSEPVELKLRDVELKFTE